MSFIGRKGNAQYQQSLVNDSVRPTGGGVDLASSISALDYSHFARTGQSVNGRIHTVYYRGRVHGQDAPEGVCLPQSGFDGLPLLMDGPYVVGGEVVLGAPTRVSLTSIYDLSYMNFTWYGDFIIDGIPAASYTMQGPATGRRFSPGTVRTTRITGVTPVGGDTVGNVSAGLHTTGSDIITKYSDDGGKTWSAGTALINGLTTGTERGYQTQILCNRNGLITILVYQLDVATGVPATIRFVSSDNGVTWGPRQTVTFTGLVGSDTNVTLYSPWRQRGGGSFVSVGSNGENSYSMTTTDGAVIACTLFAVTDHAIDNDDSWTIESIDDVANEVVLPASYGDVRDYWPADMSSVIVDTGGADGTSFVVSTAFSGGKTILTLDDVTAGTVGADSRIRHLYGPRQILACGTDTIELMYDQRANFTAGHFFGATGSSGAGLQNPDGFHKIESVSYTPGTPGRTTLTVVTDFDGPAIGPTSRVTNVVLGEWGFDCLTDVTWACVPRTNGQVSRVPMFTTNDAGSTWTYQGQTNAPEGSYVSMTLDFVEAGGDTYTVIGGFRRSGIDKFFLISSLASNLLASQTQFSDIYYWLTAAGGFPNSGYPSNVVMGNTLVVTYGIETGVEAANVQCRRVPMWPLLNPVAASSPTLKSGQYYGNVLSGAVSATAITENRLYFVPIEAPNRLTTIEAIATYVRSAAGVTTDCQIRMGAYEDDAGVPGRLIFDAGTINMTGSAGLHRIETAQTVGPGRWWIAMIANLNGGGGSLPQLPGSATAGYMQAMIGTTGGNYASFVRFLYNDQTIASWAAYTLPTVAPTASYEDSTGNTFQLVYQKA